MKRLSNQNYWETIYQKSSGEQTGRKGWRAKLRNATRNYPNFLIWERIFPKFLSESKGKSVLEVGCAPGNYLVAFASRFGMIPYGIDYTAAGVQTTRDRFVKESLDPSHVIEADFFDDTFLNRHANEFDVVYSRGFIEHFDDPASVVERHAHLLKQNGLLIILIPNLQGVNRFLAKNLNPESYAMHNTSIMKTDAFANLFPKEKYAHEFIGYVGGFSVGLFNADVPTKGKLLHMLNYVQKPFDWMWRLASPLMRIETPYTSPYLVAIMRKK
jgi:2-polyprenyl-3-methyl-5-hydroxy-6-metoxy-1,4-benzoquinol methylase